ncbi:FAD-binding oxidoreductase, partial [Mycobacterium kiyosense]
GVEPRFEEPAVTLDVSAMSAVVEVDQVSRAARIQAGALGPWIEDQLRRHDLTLRHFPQSFAFSSLGGWLATRAGGHFATLYTHIDDLTESVRVVTPAGISESRRLPGSGAGPSPDRLFIGSEGTLGVITEAWMRLQNRPRWQVTASVSFGSWAAAVAATRIIAQAGLYPANCRLLDPAEAFLNAGTSVNGGLLVLAFESADHPIDPWLD